MVYLFLADGFEEIEALCPLDLLRRAGIDIKTVGIGAKHITGAHGITVEADIFDDALDTAGAQMIILPGGMPGTANLEKSELVSRAITSAVQENAYIAAICAAPSILGKRGLLSGKSAVCYPGFEQHLHGAHIPEAKLAVDGTFITAAAMGIATEFSLTLIALLCSQAKCDDIRQSILAD